MFKHLRYLRSFVNGRIPKLMVLGHLDDLDVLKNPNLLYCKVDMSVVGIERLCIDCWFYIPIFFRLPPTKLNGLHSNFLETNFEDKNESPGKNKDHESDLWVKIRFRRPFFFTLIDEMGRLIFIDFEVLNLILKSLGIVDPGKLYLRLSKVLGVTLGCLLP